MNTRELDHQLADRLDGMARQCRMASRAEVIADQVRDERDGSAIRGLMIGLLLTALVAGCVEVVL